MSACAPAQRLAWCPEQQPLTCADRRGGRSYARAPASFETGQLLLRRVAVAGGARGEAGECALHLGAGAGAEAEASLVQEQVRAAARRRRDTAPLTGGALWQQVCNVPPHAAVPAGSSSEGGTSQTCSKSCTRWHCAPTPRPACTRLLTAEACPPALRASVATRETRRPGAARRRLWCCPTRAGWCWRSSRTAASCWACWLWRRSRRAARRARAPPPGRRSTPRPTLARPGGRAARAAAPAGGRARRRAARARAPARARPMRRWRRRP